MNEIFLKGRNGFVSTHAESFQNSLQLDFLPASIAQLVTEVHPEL